MILPTKGITPSKALLSIGADVLRVLNRPKTVSQLWSEVRSSPDKPQDITFDWFVLALDLLYILHTIEHRDGRIHRRQEREAP